MSEESAAAVIAMEKWNSNANPSYLLVQKISDSLRGSKLKLFNNNVPTNYDVV